VISSTWKKFTYPEGQYRDSIGAVQGQYRGSTGTVQGQSYIGEIRKEPILFWNCDAKLFVNSGM
jgi:hypothetical protein